MKIQRRVRKDRVTDEVVEDRTKLTFDKVEEHASFFAAFYGDGQATVEEVADLTDVLSGYFEAGNTVEVTYSTKRVRGVAGALIHLRDELMLPTGGDSIPQSMVRVGEQIVAFFEKVEEHREIAKL